MLSKQREDPVLAAATSSPPDPLPLLLANPALGLEDLTRRSDSPVANSPSKSSMARPSGSASVTSPVQIPPPNPSPLRDPLTGARIGPLAQQQQQNQGTGVSKDGQQAPTDSITLGQLKQITASFPKPKQSMYTFPSPPPDTSDLRSELEEFYSYVEVPQVLDHKDSFTSAWPHPTPFNETEKETQLSHIRSLLDGLSSTDPDIRFTNARHLLYIAQGAFASSTSPEHHISLVLSNVALLRSANALPLVWEAVKGTGLRWEGVSTIPDPDVPHSPGGFSAQERQDYLDEINGELALHLAILYFMVEVYSGDEEWAEELMALEPPMPIYLFQLVAGLREKNAKGYPVKKLLLLLWKSILSCIGGMKDVARVKSFVREVEGLPPDGKGPKTDNRPDTKVAPTDYQSFRNEITSKYPSYIAPPISSVDLDRIAAAAAPVPIRPSFSYHINPNHDLSSAYPSHGGPPGSQPPMGGGTPAPTPPSSPAPKPKKQQFQTDQSRPFVLPFSPANAGPKDRPPRAVPQSIDEASELYRKNMRISTELWQTWKLREELIADESGILKAEAVAAAAAADKERGGARAEAARMSRRMEALSISDDEDDGGEDPMDPLSMLRALEKKMRAEENAEEDTKKRKVLAQRRGDVQRLERVEILYRAILPQLQSAVIVLLKLLLATVTANTNQNMGGGAPDSGNDEVVELNLEDTDILRHREITSKAVSAILILSLKWFKTSHVMKFHYLSQLLVDSNCLLLILKMFGLQEVSTSVKTKNDRPDYSFFKFCHDKINPPTETSPRPEDAMLEAKPAGAHPTTAGGTDGAGASGEDDEVELITDFSWRNFFAVINFVHILQKLTKRKTHRVLLLVQYKSSAILKRILKVCHPTLQLYVLKVIKSQVPYCGRKWRQSNMKVITAIYLHCRPDLRDEWLTGVDVDGDVEESLPHEQALRGLVRFFNTKHYGAYAPLLHRRSSSANHPPPDFGQQMPPQSPGGTRLTDNDVFPPTRSVSSFDNDMSFRAAYGQDPLDDVGDYEVDDLLSPRADDGDLLYGDAGGAEFDSVGSRAAWDRLGDLMGHYDDISDSESVGSLNFLGFRDDDSSDGSVSDLDMDEAVSKDQIRQEWEAISPETITALEEERNAGSPNRPVIIDRDDDAADDGEVAGPAQTQPHTGPPVDEVEFDPTSMTAPADAPQDAPRFLTVREAWNPSTGKYVPYREIQSTVDSNVVFTIRHRIYSGQKEEETVIELHSAPLVHLLRSKMPQSEEIFDEKPFVPSRDIFLKLEVLKALRSVDEAVKSSPLEPGQHANGGHGNGTATDSEKLDASVHLLLLINKIEELYEPTKAKLDRLLKESSISFSLLWTHFIPGPDAFYETEDPINQERPFWTGKHFGNSSHVLYIEKYAGVRRIASLSVKPLDDQHRSQLTERGRLYVELSKVVFKHYGGVLSYANGQQVVRLKAEGRAMVDPTAYRRMNPQRYLRMNEIPQDYDSDEYDSDDYDSEGEDPRQVRTVQPTLLRGAATAENELCLLPAYVLGFSLSQREWGEMLVVDFVDIEFSDDAWTNLVIEPNQKKLIRSLIEQNSKASRQRALTTGLGLAQAASTDFVVGKGGGLVIALNGTPGTGKTLTAEACAECLHVPLYAMGAGELGVHAAELEKRLRDVLEISANWGAVLLIDEAAVFLEARSANDVVRNAMVSVFLRVLEYHSGVLVLTTNRIRTVDPAFLSRFSLAITYPDLDTPKRRLIWQSFLTRAGAALEEGSASVESGPCISTAYLEGLAAKEAFNGRSIKNTVRTAQALSDSEGRRLSEEDIEVVVKVSEAFMADMKESSAIGGSLLQSLLNSDKYSITALTRGEDKAEKLRALGVKAIIGSLDSDDLIVKATLENDIIIHTATADDQPSVKSVLKGLAQRPASRTPAVYIHTSGTGLIADEGKGLHATDHIFSDKRPEEIDALPDTAYHRDVDLLIKNAVYGKQVGSARVAIILPPLIYGIGTGPLNRLTIQIPTWVRESIKAKAVTITGEGKSIWNNIHVADLVLAYETLLDSLLNGPPPHPLYYFAETGQHRWLEVGKKIHQVLLAKGLVDSELKFDKTPNYMGSNSRSSADLLREKGWRPTQTLSVLDSIPDEIEAILATL
ncbi:hypothetical protein RQP46_004680 [Phenoliferia psychrophenolica]